MDVDGLVVALDEAGEFAEELYGYPRESEEDDGLDVDDDVVAAGL